MRHYEAMSRVTHCAGPSITVDMRSADRPINRKCLAAASVATRSSLVIGNNTTCVTFTSFLMKGFSRGRATTRRGTSLTTGAT